MPEVNNKASGQKNKARGQKNKAGARKTRSGVKKTMFPWVYWGIPLLQIEQLEKNLLVIGYVGDEKLRFYVGIVA